MITLLSKDKKVRCLPQLENSYLKTMSTEESAALITVVILIFILTILSSVILSLLANQTRLIEHDVARIKAKYASEAAMVREIERARRGQSFESGLNISGRFDTESRNWTVTVSTGPSVFPNTTELNLSINYSNL